MSDDWSFELLAAGLRQSRRDLETYIEVLAEKFAHALPDVTTVTRKGGWFAREHPVIGLSVELGDMVFALEHSAGNLVAKVVKRVRGVALKTELVALEQWVEELSHALIAYAESHQLARESLEHLLLDEP